MTSSLTIRRYSPADADRVWELHEQALRASGMEFVEDAPADEDITQIEERYLASDGEFLVGDVDGDIVAIGGHRPASIGGIQSTGIDYDPDDAVPWERHLGSEIFARELEWSDRFIEYEEKDRGR